MTDGWAAKMAALDAYESQIHRRRRARSEPLTKVASREFRRAVEGRRATSGCSSAPNGEPFWSRLPLAVGDPFRLLPGGLR